MTTLDEQVRAADPAQAVPPYNVDDVARILAAARQERTETAGTDLPVDAVGPTRRRWSLAGRRARISMALAATVLAIGAIPSLIDLPGVGQVETALPAVAAVLDKAALNATDPPARGSQYFRIRNVEVTTATQDNGEANAQVWQMTYERVEYVAVDGSRPTYVVSRKLSQPTLIAGSTTPPPPPPSFGNNTESVRTSTLTPNHLKGSWQTPTAPWLSDLPRDTTALRERMYQDAHGHGPSTDGEVLVLAADVLRSGRVPADLRTSLFKVLRTVPGVAITSEAVTLDGRRGVGIGRTETSGGFRQELIIDPDNGQVLGEREVLTQPMSSTGPPAGTVMSSRAVSQTVVDKVPDDVRRRAVTDQCTVGQDGETTCT
ncbi:hypothetical protein KEM60_02026 [Austwickia sp. TVS 96-490-7B]|uniref:CU044_5270 family protein n=1 Tax=Austwickia sp. TVS 96-490-7B TaxID=2830843 RepID=UPI001C57CEA9|nr:CU044_5270 family protein [Austwickia sp. TVS 96-490-7B]MBW3085815.1 hypothetical protein [Austwickia sp. TVS 96-490-7B]